MIAAQPLLGPCKGGEGDEKLTTAPGKEENNCSCCSSGGLQFCFMAFVFHGTVHGRKSCLLNPYCQTLLAMAHEKIFTGALDPKP